jgi:hypothetical protein
MDELLAGGSYEECSNDVDVSHVRQLGALSGQALNALMESLNQLLAAAPEVPGITTTKHKCPGSSPRKPSQGWPSCGCVG